MANASLPRLDGNHNFYCCAWSFACAACFFLCAGLVVWHRIKLECLDDLAPRFGGVNVDIDDCTHEVTLTSGWFRYAEDSAQCE